MAKKGGWLFAAVTGAFTCGICFLGDAVFRKTMCAEREDTPEEILPAGAGSGQDVTLDAIDYIKLFAREYLPAGEETPHAYAVVLPDAQMKAQEVFPYITHYLEKGMCVLVPDARGTGKSGGKWLGYGYDDRFDLMSWIHRILRQDAKAKILIHGLGTGAAQALFAGAEHLPKEVYAVLSDSCYTTLTEYLARRLRFFLPGSLPVKIRLWLLRLMTIIRAGYDIREVEPLTAVEKLNVPTLFLHGDADKQTPVDMCRALYRRAGCTRQISVFLGAGHLESERLARERYWKQADAFVLRQHPDRL